MSSNDPAHFGRIARKKTQRKRMPKCCRAAVKAYYQKKWRRLKQ